MLVPVHETICYRKQMTTFTIGAPMNTYKNTLRSRGDVSSLASTCCPRIENNECGMKTLRKLVLEVDLGFHIFVVRQKIK